MVFRPPPPDPKNKSNPLMIPEEFPRTQLKICKTNKLYGQNPHLICSKMKSSSTFEFFIQINNSKKIYNEIIIFNY